MLHMSSMISYTGSLLVGLVGHGEMSYWVVADRRGSSSDLGATSIVHGRAYKHKASFAKVEDVNG